MLRLGHLYNFKRRKDTELVKALFCSA